MSWRFLPVSRDRYEAAVREIHALRGRIAFLEDQRDALAMGALQSVLRKQGYMQIGEKDSQIVTHEPVPQWSGFDENLYAAWARDYMTATQATEKEARAKWAEEYGNSLPSRVLIY